MARPSRPPGFDMTYKPEGAVAFAPPLRDRAPAFAYFGFALAFCAVVVYGQNAPSNSRIFAYVVEGDRHRIFSSSVCAILVFVSALAAVLRSQMRGVIVHPDGVETRELLTFGWPRVRRFAWSQIDRVFVPAATPGTAVTDAPRAPTIKLDLWDGSRAWLPKVADTVGLSVLLEKVALARAIPIVGGTGLLDELEDPGDDDAPGASFAPTKATTNAPPGAPDSASAA